MLHEHHAAHHAIRCTSYELSMQEVEQDMQCILSLPYHKFISIYDLPTRNARE